MLDEQQPFKAAFQTLKFFGFWRTEDLSHRHKNNTKFLFLWLYPAAIVFLFLSLLQSENVNETVKSIFFICLLSISMGYAGTFAACSQSFEDLAADVGQIFSENFESTQHLIKLCKKMKKDKATKMVVLVVCVALGTIIPLVTGTLSTPIYTPGFLKHSACYFYFSWFYESCVMIYLATASTAAQDLFTDFLFAINAYTEFFKCHIETVDLCGDDRFSKLIECVNFHRNVRR
jgi:surface polysaccharide O-acyltransferase-like enzyme